MTCGERQYMYKDDFAGLLRNFIEGDFGVRVSITTTYDVVFIVNGTRISLKQWNNCTNKKELTTGYQIYINNKLYCFYGFGDYAKNMSEDDFIDWYANFFKNELGKIIDNYHQLIPIDLIQEDEKEDEKEE